MGLAIGIVGLPNVGKSTLFNALLGPAQARRRPTTRSAPSSPNVGVVPVPDERLDAARRARQARRRPSPPRSSSWTSPAWWPGRRKGEGLGNQFLANIRQVDAIAHVLRCFEDPDVIHVGRRWTRARDRDVVETELCSRTSRRSRSGASGRRRTPRRAGKAGRARQGRAGAARPGEGRARGGRSRCARRSSPPRTRGAAPRPLPPHRQAGALHRQRGRGAARQGGRRPARGQGEGAGRRGGRPMRRHLAARSRRRSRSCPPEERPDFLAQPGARPSRG